MAHHASTMAHHASLLLLAAAAALAASATTVAAAAAELVVHGRTADSAAWMRQGPNSCGGMLEECLGEYAVLGDGGFGLRRRLVDDGGVRGGYPRAQYISYAALMRNSVPCTVQGQSYYNCHPGAVANPYTRGCSAITQCRD